MTESKYSTQQSKINVDFSDDPERERKMLSVLAAMVQNAAKVQVLSLDEVLPSEQTISASCSYTERSLGKRTAQERLPGRERATERDRAPGGESGRKIHLGLTVPRQINRQGATTQRGVRCAQHDSKGGVRLSGRRHGGARHQCAGT